MTRLVGAVPKTHHLFRRLVSEGVLLEESHRLEAGRRRVGVRVRVPCLPRSGTVIDELPPGDSVATCTVTAQDGGSGAAFVSVLRRATHFRVHLGE